MRTPIQGIRKSKKPILETTARRKRRRLPKLPATPEADDLEEQSSIYLRERNAQMRAKRLKAEMELAHARDELIEKRLVERQLSWLLVAMRRSLLALPGKMRMKFGEERFPHEMLEAAKHLVVDALTEISRLPEAVEPGWLARLE
jgi:hypothetical protein